IATAGWIRRLDWCESRLTAPWIFCCSKVYPYARRNKASPARNPPRRRLRKGANKRFQMAKGKWQMANGRKSNLKFAFCHLPFAMIFAVLAVHGVPALQAQSPQSSSVRPPILRYVGIDQKLDQLIPLDLEFYEETGKSVRLGDYFG